MHYGALAERTSSDVILSTLEETLSADVPFFDAFFCVGKTPISCSVIQIEKVGDK